MRCMLPDPSDPRRMCGAELPCIFHGDAARPKPVSAFVGVLGGGRLLQDWKPCDYLRRGDTEDRAAMDAAVIVMGGGTPVLKIHLGKRGSVVTATDAADAAVEVVHGYAVYHQLWAWLWDLRAPPYPPRGTFASRFTYDCRRAHVFYNLMSVKAQIYALGVDPREDFTKHGFDVLRVR